MFYLFVDFVSSLFCKKGRQPTKCRFAGEAKTDVSETYDELFELSKWRR
jgi:hypothetical protein